VNRQVPIEYKRAPVDFLRWLRPKGHWTLTAIPPDGKPTTLAVKNPADAKAFVAKYNGNANIYYDVNPTHRPQNRKATKRDIQQAEYVQADLDPAADETPEAAKQRYRKKLETFDPLPSAIIDSGNGIQALWRLEEPVPPERFHDVEAASAATMEALGCGDTSPRDVSRIFRLPDTINLPTKSKRAKGRKKCPAKLLNKPNGATCLLEDFPRPAAKLAVPTRAKGTPLAIDWAKIEELAKEPRGVDDLPKNASDKLRTIVDSEDLDSLNKALQAADDLKKPYGSYSEVTFALAACLKNTGMQKEKIAAWLMADLPCNEHVTRQENPKQRRRAVERAIQESYGVIGPDWDRNKNGPPKATMHNAKRAIMALRIKCRKDTFHNKILVGHDGDSVQHEVQAIAGEVSDDTTILLREMIRGHFGFDPEDKATNDAIRALALANCFDPVSDFLDEAQGKWDERRRLDRMAVDHFNCADTPLNRAMVSIWMTAAVRRVRQPGCKFDPVLVLEGTEGRNKSTALRILAGDENFSDASLLSRVGNDRDVQEVLSGVWIHESADLAGMSRADVEALKAFASRQHDKGRPAYGRYVVEIPRRGVLAATTNNSEYLKSQTGNRRFWPLKPRGLIDIEKLKRDRVQLWAEAARRESRGGPITLPQEFWAEAAKEQEKRREKHPWEESLVNLPDHFSEYGHNSDGKLQADRLIYRENGWEKVRSVDLLKFLGVTIDRQESRHGNRVAEAMKANGWTKPDKVRIGGKLWRGFKRREQGRKPNNKR
jgi:predicted P-loop ATPase